MYIIVIIILSALLLMGWGLFSSQPNKSPSEPVGDLVAKRSVTGSDVLLQNPVARVGGCNDLDITAVTKVESIDLFNCDQDQLFSVYFSNDLRGVVERLTIPAEGYQNGTDAERIAQAVSLPALLYAATAFILDKQNNKERRRALAGYLGTKRLAILNPGQGVAHVDMLRCFAAVEQTIIKNQWDVSPTRRVSH